MIATYLPYTDYFAERSSWSERTRTRTRLTYWTRNTRFRVHTRLADNRVKMRTGSQTRHVTVGELRTTRADAWL